MDDEERKIDAAQATGTAAATIAIQYSLISALIDRKVISVEDAATIVAKADLGLDRLEFLTPEAREMAKRVLRGFSLPLTRKIEKH